MIKPVAHGTRRSWYSLVQLWTEIFQVSLSTVSAAPRLQHLGVASVVLVAEHYHGLASRKQNSLYSITNQK
ncbi:hypothetical protein Y032_0056g2698 [Ancylostoma ceylanicum]|uniref:Uncharacterized protein n=1 Tax=Ancylostoma ceylanicum TaxID=53326 RepID=A0A016U5X9_9BILA|nr:hypothetical protein Y032_0056g2698 [Ancylostoma ceylanicum]